MYSYIKGTAVDFGDGFVVVDNNGLGYEIFVSNSTLVSLKLGADCKLFLYQVVREDELSLYGFSTVAEKNLFLKLINISGVGPKMALGVLSGMNVQSLINTIISGDIKTLSRIKGVGKKTAERIVLELKEKVDDELSAPSGEQVGLGAGALDITVSNALDALENMGLPRSQAYEAVMKARQQSDSVAEIVRTVLKGLKK